MPCSSAWSSSRRAWRPSSPPSWPSCWRSPSWRPGRRRPGGGLLGGGLGVVRHRLRRLARPGHRGRVADPVGAQDVPQELAGVAGGYARDLLRRALGDHQATAGAALGSHVDHPFRGLDHVEVVLDDDDRVALVDQSAEDRQQLADVLEVQTGGRLVQDVDRAPGGAALQLTGELDALGLAAGQGGRGLARPDRRGRHPSGSSCAGRWRAPPRRIRSPPRSACSRR
ncbi:hypothetical protein SALBM311S_11115 [Streptomyces alboniger]